MPQLENKVAVVTGGGSGIGLAIAKRFAKEGASVFIFGRRQAALEAAVQEIGGEIEAVQGDATNEADLDRLFAAVKERKGRLDVLVANSGIAEYATLEETSGELFDRTFDLNTRATLFTVQKSLPLLVPGSSVVLVGSVAGSIGTPGYGVYGATKATTRSFARTWTNELASRGIRVNTLSPGPIDTSMMDAASDEVRAAISAKIPLARFGKAEEVAAAALFLASSESSYVAGAELCVDGGVSQV